MTPANVTVLVPGVEPKCEPAMVTEVPMLPDVGLRLVIVGGAGVIENACVVVLPPDAVN